MKGNIWKIIGAGAAALLCMAPLAACRPSADIGNARVEICSSDETCVVIEVLAGDNTKSLYDALSVLQKDGSLTFGGSESQYGFYLTSMNGTEATDEYYWAVYTTLESLDETVYSSASFGTLEYEDKTLALASYGVSGLPLAEGELYAIVWTEIDA